MTKQNDVVSIPFDFAKSTLLNLEQYKLLYRNSIESPETFWADQAQQFISWYSPWRAVKEGDFANASVRWYVDAKLNACYNCLDRHLTDRSDQVALIWQGNSPNETLQLTYKELFLKVCVFANVLKQEGIKKGDKVCIYLPMIPEIIIATLACARIGAIHSVVFGGFSPDALQARILDAECELVITADEGLRGEKKIPLKVNTDDALKECPKVRRVIVVKRTGASVPWNDARDRHYDSLIKDVSEVCEPEVVDANDPLFILYTSGSTGKPKGIVHSTGGYLVYAAITHRYIFDYHDKEIYWCTADLGWITGHTYLLYGPLVNGATTVMFEGIPNHPDFSRYWEIVDKFKVNVFYSSPTAIRSLRREGDDWVKKTQRKSLRLLGTVGEPINPDVCKWYFEVVGDARCPVVDTWWQTETGGIMLSPLPGAMNQKFGSVGWPFFGVSPAIVDEKGNSVANGTLGQLVITQPWPGLLQDVYHDRERLIAAYFKPVPGSYFTADLAFYDDDGYFWVQGRGDDVIKIAGHRISSGEVEGVLVSHPDVSEAAVIAIPDEIKGQAMDAFVTLKAGKKPSDKLKTELIELVRHRIGAIATLKAILWVDALPKTRSGKIIRRILRKIASGEYDALGDVSTLADPQVIQKLITAQKTQSN